MDSMTDYDFYDIMEVKNVCQQGNILEATFTNKAGSRHLLSPKYIIGGLAVFQVKRDIPRILYNGDWADCNLIYINFIKLLQEDELTYTIKLTSNELGIVNKNFISDDGTWHLIYDSRKILVSFHVTVHMYTVPGASPFAMLHEDTELADFELRGEDGSVRMHRLVLAAASPVLRRMLSGTWREVTEGCVDVPGTSKVTLQNLKDYVYLHTLPDNGLDPLLRLALCYMMKDLEQNCVYKVVSSLTAENACGWLEFATTHKVPLLLRAILECVKNESLKVDDLCKHLLDGK